MLAAGGDTCSTSKLESCNFKRTPLWVLHPPPCIPHFLPQLRDALPDQIVCFFEHCSNGLWPLPPPSFLNIYVADFSKGLLKKCVKACRDKCVKIVRKSLRKNVQSTKKLWQFYLQYVTILPPEDLFYVNSYCQIASRIIPNLQQNFWTWVWPPPPVWTMFKKTDDLVRKGVP